MFDQLQERELSELKRRFTHTKIFEEKQTSIKGTLPAEATHLVVCKGGKYVTWVTENKAGVMSCIQELSFAAKKDI